MAGTYSSRGFSVALALFVVLLGVFALLQSPFFQLREVVVEGDGPLSAAEIAATVGLDIGKNLFSLDVASAADRLLALALVEEAQVKRKLPDKIIVQVKQRRPVAYVNGPDGFWAVDKSGVALQRDDQVRRPLPLITVTMDEPQDIVYGQRVSSPELLAALRFVGALSTEGGSRISELLVASTDIVAYTQDRIVVRLGADGDMAERAQVFEGLLQQVVERNLPVAEIDLRRPRSPVFTEKR